ncbi:MULTISPECIES: ATP-binding protein [unclassified Streptomyces]|uniref:ATP-binding protein n=1 Tax=unclassified Streptomyces TaxID=2593676 RepID=UPI00278BBE14|nr:MULTISPECIES: ATP-binding protein [unclassified Streptomyces]
MNSETREHFYRRERQSIPAAREFARAALTDWHVAPDRAHDVLLCVSELTTNALLYGVPPGRGYLLRLLPHEQGLRVEVHDSGDGVPRQVRTGEGGRGLVLVAEIADAWGVGERDPGKVVWCEFGLLSPCARARMV